MEVSEHVNGNLFLEIGEIEGFNLKELMTLIEHKKIHYPFGIACKLTRWFHGRTKSRRRNNSVKNKIKSKN